MRLLNSLLDALQSGLVLTMLILWGVELALSFVWKVFFQSAVKINSWRNRRTYSRGLVASLEPPSFQVERGLPPRLSTT